MTELMTTFTSSDTDNDGLLNRAELEDFLSKMLQNSQARGVPAESPSDFSDDIKQKAYAFYNAFNPMREGVAAMDFLQCTMQLNMQVGQLIAASQAQ